jgi:hypothetical protein
MGRHGRPIGSDEAGGQPEEDAVEAADGAPPPSRNDVPASPARRQSAADRPAANPARGPARGLDQAPTEPLAGPAGGLDPAPAEPVGAPARGPHRAPTDPVGGPARGPHRATPIEPADVLPDIPAEETDEGWGEPPGRSDDDRFLGELPPHHLG